ncbi:MAG: transcriptional regulator GlxA family with amidase domain [Halioglobus sp.]|jgi:transcriptional regulator GlxA family with amidase domain
MNVSLLDITAHQLHDSSGIVNEEILEDHISLGIKNQLLSVQWLANRMEMSERHLLRLFKKHHKVTCHKYLQDVKLNAAKKLLIMKSSLSIKKISAMLLFSDTKYFSKLFKQRFGLNPSDFRSKNISN